MLCSAVSAYEAAYEPLLLSLMFWGKFKLVPISYLQCIAL